MKRWLTLLFLMLLLTSVMLPVSAAAANEPYTYTIRVFAGNMGTVDGGDVAEFKPISYGEEWAFDLSTVAVTNTKYYVKGIRESGLDNDMVSSAAFVVTQDMDFVVAYGMKGNEVAYTLSFVRDSDGVQLADSVTYYGNVGDKPVAACKFIEGYYPRYYNITGTLSENAAANQFVFRYLPSPVTTTGTAAVGNPVVINPNQNNANRPGNTAPAGTGNGNAEPPQGGDVPPRPENILDMDVPLAGPDNAQTGFDGSMAALVAVIVAGLALLLFLIWLLMKKRKKEQEEELKP